MTSQVDSVRSPPPVPVSQTSPRRSVSSGVAEVPTVLESAEESKSTKLIEPGFFETCVVGFIGLVSHLAQTVWKYLKVNVILKFFIKPQLQPTESALPKPSLNPEKNN